MLFEKQVYKGSRLYEELFSQRYLSREASSDINADSIVPDATQQCDY